MKKIFILMMFVQTMSFGQTKTADWTCYGSGFTYSNSEYNSGKNNPMSFDTEFVTLGDEKFAFTVAKGPLTFYDGGKTYPTSRVVFDPVPKENTSLITGGMTENAVALFVDQNKTIWFGTTKGLLNIPKQVYATLPGSLDNLSSNIKGTFYTDKTSGMPFAKISSITGDAQGNVWVAGLKKKDALSFQPEGVSRFDGKQWKQFIPTTKLENEITRLTTANNILYGVIGTDIFKLEGDVWTFYGMPSATVTLLKVDRRGIIYAGTSVGVFHLEDGKWTKVDLTNFEGNVTSIDFDSNSMWVGSNTNGVYQLLSDGSQNRLNKQNSPLVSDAIRKISVDQENKKWFYTESGWVSFKEPVLSNDKVDILNRYNSGFHYEFVEDAFYFNNIWYFAMSDAGLVTYDGKGFKKISTKAETSHTSIAADKNGKVYMGTSKFLYTLDGDKLEKWDIKEDAIAKQINDVIVDDKNQVWLAHNKGVSKYDGTSWQHFDKKTGLGSNYALILFQDSKSNIWLVTNDGISKYNGSAWENFTKKIAGFSLGNIKGIVETNGKILFSNGWSLIEYDGTALKEDPAFKRIDGGINHMSADADGNLWFASVDKGVIKFSKGILTYYSTQDGLPANNINRIFVHTNEVWASSGYKKPYEFTPMGSTTTTTTPPKPSEKQLFETKVKDFEPQFAMIRIKK